MSDKPRNLPPRLTARDANGQMRTITDPAEIAALINKLSPEARRALDELSAAVEDALALVMKKEAQHERVMHEQDSAHEATTPEGK